MLALLAATPDAQSRALRPGPPLAAAVTGAHTPYRHLYVADVQLKEVLRFPLRSNGLPAANPDLVLQGGMIYPVSIAIDPVGNLVVSDAAGAGASAVKTYAPGASGNDQPISQLTLPNNDNPYNLDMDPRGYLYVEDLDLGSRGPGVDIFAPGAKGLDPPIATTGSLKHGTIWSVKTDAHGRLYVGFLLYGPWVYLDPLHQLQHPDIVINANPNQHFINSYVGPIAIEEPDTLYTFASANILPPYWELSDFAAHNIFERPGRVDPVIFGDHCYYGGPKLISRRYEQLSHI